MTTNYYPEFKYLEITSGFMRESHTELVRNQRWDLLPESRATLWICLN